MGKKGGKVRALVLTATQRSLIASLGGQAKAKKRRERESLKESA